MRLRNPPTAYQFRTAIREKIQVGSDLRVSRDHLQLTGRGCGRPKLPQSSAAEKRSVCVSLLADPSSRAPVRHTAPGLAPSESENKCAAFFLLRPGSFFWTAFLFRFLALEKTIEYILVCCAVTKSALWSNGADLAHLVACPIKTTVVSCHRYGYSLDSAYYPFS